jgi:hypothetical protein
MEKSRKNLREALKSQYMEMLMQMLGAQEDVGKTGSNEFNFPVVDSEGNEDFIVVKLVIPTGSRDGEEYDGYGARNDYQLKLKEKAEKAAAAKAAKEKKIAQDKARREKKA